MNFALRKSESQSPSLHPLKLDYNKTRSSDIKGEYFNFCDEDSDESLPDKATKTKTTEFLLENQETSKMTAEEHMKRMSDQYNFMVSHV
jgi:hypothetical protein